MLRSSTIGGGGIFWTKMLAITAALARCFITIFREKTHTKPRHDAPEECNFKSYPNNYVPEEHYLRAVARDSVVYHQQQLPSSEKCVITELAALAQQMIRSRGVLASGNKG